MIQIQLTQIKDFMSHLLIADTFDKFLLIEGEIVTFNKFSIDGHIQKKYYSTEDSSNNGNIPEYSTWDSLKCHCYSLIKGQKAPLSFFFIFRFPDCMIDAFLGKHIYGPALDNLQGLYMNIHFENQSLRITTGIATKAFSLEDKDINKAWDKAFIDFIDTLNITYNNE